MARLGDLIKLAKVIRCDNGNYPVLSMTMHDGIILQSSRFKKSIASIDKSNYKVVQYGQLVVGFPIDEGVLYIQKVTTAGIMSPAYNIWDVDTSLIDINYLEYCLHSPQSMQFYKANLRGTTARRRSIPTDILLELFIPLPSLDEQRRIAALLDKVSDLITKRRAQLDKLDLLVKARFVEMFGDPFINSMTWERIKIKDAVTVEPQNGMYKPQSDYVTDGSGTPILRIDGFYDGVVTDFSSLKRLRCNDKEKQKYLLKENDIVINRVNSIEYLGKCAHITGLIEETVYESNMMRMHFDTARFNPVYITHLLCSRFVYDQVVNHAKKAVNQASINQKDVLDFDVYQPPIDFQNVFADFVNQVERSKLKLRQSLDKLETLKKALMQQYFG